MHDVETRLLGSRSSASLVIRPTLVRRSRLVASSDDAEGAPLLMTSRRLKAAMPLLFGRQDDPPTAQPVALHADPKHKGPGVWDSARYDAAALNATRASATALSANRRRCTACLELRGTRTLVLRAMGEMEFEEGPRFR